MISSSHKASLITTLAFLVLSKGCLGAIFTMINRCDYTVWPGILSNAGSSSLGITGFELSPGGSRYFQAQPGWSGRVWGRTGCAFDPTTGEGSCATGHCGSNKIECNGAGANPPATLAEFTIASGAIQDFYDVSLVDGFNVPMIIEPVGGSGTCGSTGCIADLNQICPAELRAEDGQACKSACEAFRNPEYCCSGAFGSPATCQPSVYSEVFKRACPRAYSYAYDDATSTFTCSGSDYTITFCPSITSQKSSRDSSPGVMTTVGFTPPAAAAAAMGTTEVQPAVPDDGLPGWMPNFVVGAARPIAPCSLNLLLSVLVLLFAFRALP